ncbi:MAG: ribonuclease H-like domain-containing protein [Syntrophales bacterium]|jgi:uncharacterized protein YprB with RNaseH-like and TPR domain|nr:ribonuclease H-like domain-containing protein [Syntrophales bacterium]MCK9527275.1 ribonuclease H-like domain-containing protein [Syntrophales bacterium]MDX9921255.1 ribonuclease H-like domain-containing protein [Syntrophales bacterium]
MSVITRLHRLTGENAPEKKPGTDHGRDRDRTMNGLRRRVEAIMSRRPAGRPAAPVRDRLFDESDARDLAEVIRGEVVRNDHGSCFVVDDSLEESVRHGALSVADMRGVDMKQIALLAHDDSLADMDPAGALFLDTETTGLAGGTGTTAFLIGLGWFEGSSLVTRQIFLRDFDEEGAALAELSRALRKRSFLVTFNGKAFDVGLLVTRCIMNRRENPFEGIPHLDLLFPSRRLLGHRLENCRLCTLEEQVLDLRRSGDIPGFEIPGRYFEWLRRRDGRLMEDVFEHNRVDVVSMAALSAHLADIVREDPRNRRTVHEDLLAAARLRLDRGDPAGGRRILEHLLGEESGETTLEAARALSLIHRRAGNWREARALWEQILAEQPGDLFALQELAKWYEHHARDYEQALDLVERALAETTGLNPLRRQSLVHRRKRLLRRSGAATT